MDTKGISLKSLFFAAGSIHLATAALGTLVALEIAANGGTQEEASLVASSYSLGFLIGCFYIGAPIARIGHIRAFSAAAALCVICTLLLTETSVSPAIMLARFFTGLATAGLYGIVDAWINETAEDQSRGRILSVYSIVLGVSSIVSQGLVILYDEDYNGAFVACSGLYCLAIMVLVFARTEPGRPEQTAKIRILSVFKTSPTAFVGAFVNGFLVTIILNIVPFHASELGLGSTIIATIISMIYLGRVILQYPLGAASDKMDRRYVIIAVSAVLSIVFLLLAIFSPRDGSHLTGAGAPALQVLFIITSLVIGGTLLPVYSLLTAHAMDRTVPVYVGSTVVTLLFVFSVGGVAGPLVNAGFATVFGDAAMIWLCGGLSGLFAVFAFYRTKRQDPTPRAEHATVRPGVQTSVQMAPLEKR